MNQNETTLDNLMSVRAFVTRYPDLGKSEKSLRWEVFRSASNGLAEHGGIIRHGSRVYIDAPRYRNWLLNRRGKP